MRNRHFRRATSRIEGCLPGPIELLLPNSPMFLDMIYLDSYGASLALDTATSEGSAEWDRLDARLREGEAGLPEIRRPLRVNRVRPLSARSDRVRSGCKTVVMPGNLQRLIRELEGELAQLGS